MVTAMPTATATILPSASMLPAAEGITTLEDATRVSAEIKKEVDKLSELTNSDVVAAGNMVLVGIQYDTQYQGGLTDRLKTMVDQRVQVADKGLTVVHVTDNTKQVQEIQKLATQMQKSEITFAELQTRMLEISSQISGTGLGTGTGTGTGTGVTQPQATTGA